MVHRRRGLTVLAGMLLALMAPSAASAQLVRSQALPQVPSPELIERAQEAGRIDNETANLYRVYALKGDSRLPGAYESNTPFDGTLELRKARRELRRMEPGTARTRVATALRTPPPDPNVTFCDVLSATPLPNSSESDHFYIQYNAATLGGGLTIADYEDSLDTAWEQEVGVFGWAAPPLFTDNPAPDGLYHVRIEALAPVLYGFVSSQGTYAGPVGNNPNTAWDDVDADASCMGLNQDYSTFPGTPRQALDATTAHEFNHSLQFGYGALNGDNAPDDNFIEGGATWMEDEAYDTANDNYNYLYPQFDDSMGEHDEGDIYAYWLTWRGLTERFGTGTPNGGEQVMQDFWELTSKNEADTLTAMQQALVNKGTTLPDAYHDYAIAAKIMRPCGNGYFLPYCFEEADGYRDAAGEPGSHGSIESPDESSGTIEDNYTLNWVDLPITGGYDLTLTNDAPAGGTLRGTVACDTGTAVALEPFPVKVGAGQSTQISGFDPETCERAVAVITNETQTAPNPPASTDRPYTLTAASAPATNPPNAITDTLPPDTRITSGPGAFTSSTNVAFGFDSSKPGSTFDCQFDGGAWTPCTSPAQQGPLTEGGHSFAVRATGPGGTDPSPDARSFTVDTTPPDTQITAGPSGTIRSSSATFAFASEASSRLQCRLDGEAFARCSSPTTRSGLPDGQHTFEVRAQDRAENNDPTPASRTFVVDTKPANISVRDTVRPVLTRLRLTSRRFRATRSGRAITAARRGTRVRYSLTEAATVAVRYERKTTGRRVDGDCRTTTRANSQRARCVRWILVRGTARHRAKAGANSFRLTGRMNGRALRVGVYRLRLSARDGAGNASRARRSASFRIARR